MLVPHYQRCRPALEHTLPTAPNYINSITVSDRNVAISLSVIPSQGRVFLPFLRFAIAGKETTLKVCYFLSLKVKHPLTAVITLLYFKQ